MELKEVSVSVKLTRNFDSYMVTKTFMVKEGEEVNMEDLLRESEKDVENYLEAKEAEQLGGLLNG